MLSVPAKKTRAIGEFSASRHSISLCVLFVGIVESTQNDRHWPIPHCYLDLSPCSHPQSR